MDEMLRWMNREQVSRSKIGCAHHSVPLQLCEHSLLGSQTLTLRRDLRKYLAIFPLLLHFTDKVSEVKKAKVTSQHE